jgi:SRSO17 transposase
MATRRSNARERRFRDDLDRLARTLGHENRRESLRAYLTGSCLPGDRKSIVPVIARIDPRHVRARHQSIHRLVANARWGDAVVVRVARDPVLAWKERHGPLATWLVEVAR